MFPVVYRSDENIMSLNHSTRNIPVCYVTHDSNDNKS